MGTVLFRPDREDYRLVGLYLSRVLTAVGLVMLVPAAVGFLRDEFAPAWQFVLSAGLTLSVGQLGEWRLHGSGELDHSHGMVIAGLSWLVGPLFGAIPLFLSGHFAGFLDAYFDAMSGFATAGLTVINDLDHAPDALNLWRHLMQFVGGQGLVLVVLVLFAPAGGASTMYVGEAREERILPSVVTTARFIGRVSLGWLLAGGSVIVAVLWWQGLGPWDGVFHGLTLFMAAFSTGGFAPTTASVALYHSVWLELALSVVMVGGAASFGVHYLLWQRRRRDVVQHLEVRTFAVVLVLLTAIGLIGLWRTHTYPDFASMLRRGGFYLLSAQTTTGFATVPSRTLVADWGVLAPGMVVTAMMVGAMSGSTGGGIKTIRVGLAWKGLRRELRKVFLPSNALATESYRAGRVQLLRPDVLEPALMILLGFLLLYAAGALVGMFYGYPFDQAFFESSSAGATVGLSIGMTGPSLPTGLKLVYILQMWMGRLELVAAFAVFGFGYTSLRGRP